MPDSGDLVVDRPSSCATRWRYRIMAGRFQAPAPDRTITSHLRPSRSEVPPRTLPPRMKYPNNFAVLHLNPAECMAPPSSLEDRRLRLRATSASTATSHTYL